MDLGGTWDEASAVIVQPDGRIGVAGSVDLSTGADRAVVARLTDNGDLDPTFMGGGMFDFELASVTGTLPGNEIVDLALQADGKLVLAGAGTNPTPISGDIAVARIDL